jgi:Zn-dependent protease with chaperone function
MTKLDPQQYVAPGTGLHTALGYTITIVLGTLFIVATAVGTMGIALVAWAIAGLFYFSRVKKARATLRGSALRVDQTQFPAIHAIVADLCARLDITELPEVYIIEDNHQNAFALKHGARKYVVLVDDIVHGALNTGNEKVLSFIVAHELAHHALGHTNLLRGIVSTSYKPLSRLDEFSCDAVAHALTGEAASSKDALALLLIGPHLFASVNRAALDQQALQVADDKYSARAERTLSHPLLLRRYARIMA